MANQPMGFRTTRPARVRVRRSRIIIDFNTKFIGPEKQVWSLFPGREYKFFQQFSERGVVFGDFPGLLLKEFDIGNDTLLKQWIAMSDKIRASYVGSDKEEPSRDPDDYKRYSWTKHRLHSKGVVNGLYSRAKKGDLVLVTSRGGAWGRTMVGEFIDPPDEIIYETFRGYRRERIPARRVRWLSPIDNRTIPEELFRTLTSPAAFSQVGRSHFNFVFERAYGNFMRTEMANSMFDIRAEEFSTVPDMYLKIIANFAAEVVRGIENDSLEEFMSRPLGDWIFDIEEDEFFANQKISISSPGKNFLHSIKITPILAVVFFALCLHPAQKIHASDLEFTNSATGGQLDECDIPVVEAAKVAVQVMSLEKLELMCRAATKAEKMGRVKTPIRTQLVETDGN